MQATAEQYSPSATSAPSSRYRRITLDLVLMTIALAITYVVALKFDLVDRLHDWVRDNEQWEVDEILVQGLVLSLALVIFSIRRILDFKSESTHALTLTSSLETRGRELQKEVEVRAVAEDRLRASMAFQDAVIEHIPGLLFIKDAKDLRFLLFNKSGLELLGFTRHELLGKNDYDFFPKEQADFFVARDREVLKSLKPTVVAEEPITTRHHGVRILQTTKVPVVDDDGQPRYLLGFSQDITDRKSIEQQLRQAVKMEAVGQLTGGVAHDFNNLLGVIVGNLDLVLEQVPQTQKAHVLANEALQSALRGAELVQRLLAFSRKQSLRTASIDVSALLAEIATILRRTLGESIELKIKPDKKLWHGLADRSQIEEAILNIAINARDAMPNGGTLAIEAGNVELDQLYASQNADVKAGEYVQLSITDSGSGMSPEVLDHVFEPFFTTKEVGRGSGLGLSMVYGFMKQIGGHIKIYSEIGFGTTVRLYIPRAEQPDVNQSESVQSDIVKGHETILAVEDNPHLRKITIEQLASLGYQALAAENGHSALALIQANPKIDLLFTDIVMPGGMTGCDLARAALEIRPQLKVLLTSGYTSQGVANGCSGMDDLELLTKPFRKVDLATKIRSVLDQ
jgi:PAS domain S-box-containing protein